MVPTAMAEVQPTLKRLIQTAGVRNRELIVSQVTNWIDQARPYFNKYRALRPNWAENCRPMNPNFDGICDNYQGRLVVAGFVDRWDAVDAAAVADAPVLRGPFCGPAGTPPRALILVMRERSPLLVDKLYQDVPLAIALVFDEPYSGDSYPISIDTGGGKLDLEATPVNDARTWFQTRTFRIGAP
jgi:hypothetical protein